MLRVLRGSSFEMVKNHFFLVIHVGVSTADLIKRSELSTNADKLVTGLNVLLRDFVAKAIN